jgi:hypothetical protein
MTIPTKKLGLGALSLAPLLAALLAGCTVSSGDDDTVDNTCHTDSGVTCQTPSVGYSCNGTGNPADTDSSIVCGDGITDGGETSFCCGPRTISNECLIDSSITSCGSTSTPYTCTGSSLPTDTDPSLSCGAGVPGSDGSLSYCCTASDTTADCTEDDTLTSCGDVSTGYRCTGDVTPPDVDSTLVCGDGVDGGDGTEAYCCIVFTSTTCSADPDVVGCTGDSYGFSCTSDAAPDDEDPSLNCSDPTPGDDGKSLYCCSQ